MDEQTLLPFEQVLRAADAGGQCGNRGLGLELIAAFAERLGRRTLEAGNPHRGWLGRSGTNSSERLPSRACLHEPLLPRNVVSC